MKTGNAASPLGFCDRFVVGIVAFVVGFYGSWAVLVQTAVQLSATLSQVKWLMPISTALGVALAVTATRLRIGSLAHERPAASSMKGVLQDRTLIGWAVLAAGLAGCFGVALILDSARSDAMADYIVCFGCLAFLGIAWGFLVADKGPHSESLKDSPTSTASQFAAFVILFSLALIPLFFHKPSSDDALFLNLAEAMIADPRAILTYDGILGDPDQPLMLPTYRVEVYHALVASVAVWLGGEAIVAAHLILAPVTSLTIACAYYLFSRVLGGREWFTAFLIGVAILLLSADVYNGYGGFSFVRSQQGKALLFSGMVPLIYSFATLYWLTQSRFFLVLLFASAAASSGVSANGLFIAPFALLIAGCALFAAGPTNFRKLVLVGLMGVWPVLAGVTVMVTTGVYPSEFDYFQSVSENLGRVFGLTRGMPLFALALSAWLLFEGWTRRFLLACGVLFLVILVDPLIDPFLAKAVTGNLNWRLLHTFPAPLFAGLAVSALWARFAPVLPFARPMWAAGVAGLTGLIAFSPISLLHDRGRTHFAAFGLDVHEQHGFARRVHDTLNDTSVVLAPRYVGDWLSTFPRPKALVATRSMYMIHYRNTRPADDIDRRVAAFDLVNSGQLDGPSVSQLLAKDVDEFGITDVVIPRSNSRYDEITSALNAMRFRIVTTSDRYIHLQRRISTHNSPSSQP